MKLKELSNQWADKNPGWLVVGIWMLCSIMFYTAVSVGTYLMVVLTASFGWLFFVGCALSGGALAIWHIYKAPKFKIWQWGALLLGGALALSIAIYLLGCLGLFIMSSPISSLICSLIGGGAITGATYLNAAKKEKVSECYDSSRTSKKGNGQPHSLSRQQGTNLLPQRK